MRRICGGLMAAVLGQFLVGCGGSGAPPEPKFDLVPASGIVMLDGNPLADAQVSFIFQGSPPAGFLGSAAKTGPDGKFTVLTGSKPGTVVGSYKVIVSRLTAPDGSSFKLDPDSGMDLAMLQASGEAKELVPERYTNVESTELTATVEKTSKNEFEYKLTGS